MKELSSQTIKELETLSEDAKQALLDGFPGEAVELLRNVYEGLVSENQFDEAQKAHELTELLLQIFFPGYKTDGELIEDIKEWSRARLYVLYCPDERSESESIYSDREVMELRAGWSLKLSNTVADLRILKFARDLNLFTEDVLWLLVLLGVEEDIKFHSLRRLWVNDDDFYSVGLILNLLSHGDSELFLRRLDARSQLIRHRLVYLNTPATRFGTGLRNHLIELDESVSAYLDGRDFWPAGIDSIAKLHPIADRPGQLYFGKKLESLDRAMHQDGRDITYCFLLINGVTLGTCMSLALTWAARHERPLLEVRAQLLFNNPADFETIFRLIIREALLRDAIIFIEAQRLWGDGSDGASEVLRGIERSAPYYGQPILFDAPPEGEDIIKRTLSPIFEVRILPPTLDEQILIWEDALEYAGLEPIPEQSLRTRVCDMALSVEDIHRAVRLAYDNAWLKGNPEEAMRVKPESLRAMATSKLNQGMYALADRITTTLTWNDAILPSEVLERLMEVVTYARYQRKVFEEWGFGAKVPYGRANSSLFVGPPGTGKTMVAGIIAHELGMDLFRVDMSQMVSKYIGETEKNLAKIFDEASRSHAVMLFDEADSLFAKRTEVKSHHDRYSNLEVNYLLQRIETFDGVTILTSNFPKNIDDAFARRIKFKVNFPFPDEKDRENLWRIMLPRDARVSNDIDFERISKIFEFSGANIKDAILRSAFKAAERGCPIHTELLEEAGIVVYREMGKLIRVRDGRVALPDDK